MPKANTRPRQQILTFALWRLYDKDGNCLGHARAFKRSEAENVFKYRGLAGHRIRKFKPNAP